MLCMDLHLLVLNVKPKMVIDAQVLIRYPNQCEEGDQVAPPIVVKEFKTGENQNRRCNVVAETVFAGKQIKELSSRECSGIFRLLLTIVARFAEDSFVGDRPCDAGHRYR